MKNIKTILMSIFILFILFQGAVYFYQKNESKKIENVTSKNDTIFQREYSITFGANEKNVTVVEFIDPECYPCKQFYPMINKMFNKYNKDIALVIKYLPNHRNSEEIIKILEASRFQNKYKEVLAVLFDKQDLWSAFNYENPNLKWNFLKTIKDLNIEKLKIDMNDTKIQAIINQDNMDARVLGVRGTPAVFVNGKRLAVLSLEELMALVESEVNKK